MPKKTQSEARDTPCAGLLPDEETREAMKQMAQRIQELTTQDEDLCRELRTISSNLLQKINHRHDKAYGHIDEALNARVHGAPARDGEESELRERHDEMITKINGIRAEIRSTKDALSDQVSFYGQSRDFQLYEAYERLKKRIREAVRPFCADDDDAEVMAALFPIVRGIHERIGIWGGVGASHNVSYSCTRLLNELAEPIPQ